MPEGDIAVPSGGDDGHDERHDDPVQGDGRSLSAATTPASKDPSGRAVQFDSEAQAEIRNHGDCSAISATGERRTSVDPLGDVGSPTSEDEHFERTMQPKPQPPTFPKVFFDPVTGRVMTNPVVNPAGDSVEKPSNTAAAVAVTYYPNRALQAIIKRETQDQRPTTFRASVRRIDSALQTGWGRLVGNSAFLSNYKPLPETFYCPIMCELIVDPVIAPDGYTYEREAIENWVRVNKMSPLTRSAMTISQLRPNNALYELIQREKNRTLDSMHPSIRRWKDSTALTSRRPLVPAATVTNAEDTTTSAPSASTATTPTTNAELLQQRRRQREESQNEKGLATIILATVTVVVLFLPFSFLTVFLLMLTCACLLSQADATMGDDRQHV